MLERLSFSEGLIFDRTISGEDTLSESK